MPKISVLIPICNVEKYLRQCLDSVVSQTLSDIEIICINDGSTDNSLAIINEYAAKDKRVKVIDKANSGYGDSMNRGIDLATGDYIGIVESDDYAEPDMFEKLYALAQKHHADVAASDYFEYISAQDMHVKANFVTLNMVGNVHTVPNLLSCFPMVWSAIYRRDFLNEKGIRFLPSPGASYQDTGFVYKTLIMAQTYVLCSDAFIHYRQDNMNSSVKSKSKVYALCDEYAELWRYFGQYPEVEKFISPFLVAREFKGYLWNLRRIDKSFRPDFVQKIKSVFETHAAQGRLTPEALALMNTKRLNWMLKNPKKLLGYANKKDKFYARFSERIYSSKTMADKTTKVVTVLGIPFRFKRG